MALEGNFRELYYNFLDNFVLIDENFRIETREKDHRLII